MSTATRVARVLVLTALVLVVPVTAAQARPYIAPTAPAAPQASLSAIEHSSQPVHPAPTVPKQIGPVFGTQTPSPRAALLHPVVVTTPSDSKGFSWGDAGLGAGVALVLLGTIALATSRTRGRVPQV
jgi:hypothetical protein